MDRNCRPACETTLPSRQLRPAALDLGSPGPCFSAERSYLLFSSNSRFQGFGRHFLENSHGLLLIVEIPTQFSWGFTRLSRAHQICPFIDQIMNNEGTPHMPSKWGSQNYMSTLSDHIRQSDSPLKTRKKLNFRRFSQELDQEQSTEKKQRLHVIGNSNSKLTEERRALLGHRQSQGIEPFKIKDFIPRINPQIKRELIRQNKQNFLDFLLVQKAGRDGDQKFFDALIHEYQFDPFKKSLISLKEDEKGKISYLSKRDEREDVIEKQVKQLYRSLKKKKKNPQEEPLDKMIIQKNQYLIQRLPKFKAKLESLKQI